MKISDAKHLYTNKLDSLKNQKSKLNMQNAEQMITNNTSTNNESIIRDAVKLELNYNSSIKSQLDNAIKEVQDTLSRIYAYESAKQQFESSKQNAEAQADAMEELMKIIEISRRISKGGIVPYEDEQKLMEYSHEMYIMAKTAGMMAKEHEEYDSMFEDEENTEETKSTDIEDLEINMADNFSTKTVIESAAVTDIN